MTDERRERYARALRGAHARCPDPASRMDAMADAAMAEADAELGNLRGSLSVQMILRGLDRQQRLEEALSENARLRAELAEANREIDTTRWETCSVNSADDRRERYAQAIWGEAVWATLDDARRGAVAAMAVADEEISTRLRAEVEELASAGFVQASGFLAGGIDD